MSWLRIRSLVTVTVGVTLAAAAHANSVFLTNGTDDLCGGGTETTSPDPNLVACCAGANGPKDYDSATFDAAVIDRFDVSLYAGSIAAATLHFRARPQGGGSGNDSVSFRFGGTAFPNDGETLAIVTASPWTTAGPACGPLYSFEAQPTTVAAMNAMGFVDAYVQDDTVVDFFMLELELLMDGTEDFCALPTEPTDPAAAVVACCTGPGTKDFDDPAFDRVVMHTFDISAFQPDIIGAELNFRAKPETGGSSNDGLTLRFETAIDAGAAFTNQGQTLQAISGATAWTDTFVANCNDLYTVTANPTTLAQMNDQNTVGNVAGEIDIYVQDDTTIDFFELELTLSDVDGDGIQDSIDNCTEIANAPPFDCDTDGDGFGNCCDGDCNNDGFVDAQDFTDCWLPDFLTGVDSGVGSDMNCDGVVDALDFVNHFLPQFQRGAPGP